MVDGPHIQVEGEGPSIVATGDGAGVLVEGNGPQVTATVVVGDAADGVTVHNLLSGRSAADAHPISSITGLQAALDAAGGGGATVIYPPDTGDVDLADYELSLGLNIVVMPSPDDGPQTVTLPPWTSAGQRFLFAYANTRDQSDDLWSVTVADEGAEGIIVGNGTQTVLATLPYLLDPADGATFSVVAVAGSTWTLDPAPAGTGGGAAAPTAYIFDADGSQTGNRYNTWADLQTAISAAPYGPKSIQIVDRQTVPDGFALDLNGGTLSTATDNGDRGVLIFGDGATLTGTGQVVADGFLVMVSESSTPVLTSVSALRFGFGVYVAATDAPFIDMSGTTGDNQVVFLEDARLADGARLAATGVLDGSNNPYVTAPALVVSGTPDFAGVFTVSGTCAVDDGMISCPEAQPFAFGVGSAAMDLQGWTTIEGDPITWLDFSNHPIDVTAMVIGAVDIAAAEGILPFTGAPAGATYLFGCAFYATPTTIAAGSVTGGVGAGIYEWNGTDTLTFRGNPPLGTHVLCVQAADFTGTYNFALTGVGQIVDNGGATFAAVLATTTRTADVISGTATLPGPGAYILLNGPTVTLPSATSYLGQRISVQSAGTGTATVAPASGEAFEDDEAQVQTTATAVPATRLLEWEAVAAASGVLGSSDGWVLVSVSDSAGSGGPPTGGAGGVLSGSYPNPGFAVDMVEQTELTSAIAALSTVYQPLDSDLTAIAALTTTSFGRSVLELANAAAGRTLFGLGTAATSASTDFQPIDSDLTAIAALTTTSFGRSVLEAANAAALRTLAGTVIGTDVQAFDADLATIAGLTATTDSFIQAKAGAWAARTVAQVKTDLAYATIATSGSASDLSAGTVPTSRLGSGTASAATHLTGAQTYVERARTVGYQGAGSQITNQTAATLLNATVTMPALAAGEVLKFEGTYRWNNQAGATRGAVFIVKVGSTSIVTCTTSVLSSNASDRSGYFSGYVLATASGAESVGFHCHHFNQGVDTPGALGTAYGTGTEAVQTAGLAFDLLGTASVSTQLQVQSFSIWKVAA